MVCVRIHFIGMSNDDFSDKICAYKPLKTFCWEDSKLDEDNYLSTYTEYAFCSYFRSEEDNLASKSDFNKYAQKYIKYGDYLIRIVKDKTISEIKTELGINEVVFEIMLNMGGASIHNSGYEFCVHSNENIHKNSPHVHVKKGNYSVRYSLVTYERNEKDKVSREYLRDEKSIIIPYIKKNAELFREWWQKAIPGYEFPVLDEEGRQHLESYE